MMTGNLLQKFIDAYMNKVYEEKLEELLEDLKQEKTENNKEKKENKENVGNGKKWVESLFKDL